VRFLIRALYLHQRSMADEKIPVPSMRPNVGWSMSSLPPLSMEFGTILGFAGKAVDEPAVFDAADLLPIEHASEQKLTAPSASAAAAASSASAASAPSAAIDISAGASALTPSSSVRQCALWPNVLTVSIFGVTEVDSKRGPEIQKMALYSSPQVRLGSESGVSPSAVVLDESTIAGLPAYALPHGLWESIHTTRQTGFTHSFVFDNQQQAMVRHLLPETRVPK
jgi:hypothetical protein